MSTNHVSVRLDARTVARVDALAPQLSTEWRRATRSDVLRALILSALEHYEQQGKEGEPPRGRGGGAGRRGRGR